MGKRNCYRLQTSGIKVLLVYLHMAQGEASRRPWWKSQFGLVLVQSTAHVAHKNYYYLMSPKWKGKLWQPKERKQTTSRGSSCAQGRQPNKKNTYVCQRNGNFLCQRKSKAMEHINRRVLLCISREGQGPVLLLPVQS